MNLFFVSFIGSLPLSGNSGFKVSVLWHLTKWHLQTPGKKQFSLSRKFCVGFLNSCFSACFIPWTAFLYAFMLLKKCTEKIACIYYVCVRPSWGWCLTVWRPGCSELYPDYWTCPSCPLSPCCASCLCAASACWLCSSPWSRSYLPKPTTKGACWMTTTLCWSVFGKDLLLIWNIDLISSSLP